MKPLPLTIFRRLEPLNTIILLSSLICRLLMLRLIACPWAPAFMTERLNRPWSHFPTARISVAYDNRLNRAISTTEVVAADTKILKLTPARREDGNDGLKQVSQVGHNKRQIES
jgi:hypothetical protein